MAHHLSMSSNLWRVIFDPTLQPYLLKKIWQLYEKTY